MHQAMELNNGINQMLVTHFNLARPILFYTDRAGSSLFDRRSASGNYSVDGLVSSVYSRSTNYSGGDNGTEAYPNASNSWWPFQRLHVVE